MKVEDTFYTAVFVSAKRIPGVPLGLAHQCEDILMDLAQQWDWRPNRYKKTENALNLKTVC
jgi:hypothetical protein